MADSSKPRVWNTFKHKGYNQNLKKTRFILAFGLFRVCEQRWDVFLKNLQWDSRLLFVERDSHTIKSKLKPQKANILVRTLYCPKSAITEFKKASISTPRV